MSQKMYVLDMITRELQLPGQHSFFLFGPRQTGKSTLIRSLYGSPGTIYYDLLRTEEYRKLSARPELLRAEITGVMSAGSRIDHVIIDEVQRVPQLLDEVHALMEEVQGISFILSGSSARKLKRSHANMLGGRAWTYHLFPLTAAEIGECFDLSRALRFGTLPGIYLDESDSNRSESLGSYVETYIREEIELEAHCCAVPA
jgi:predicted AAA+ superfamily ATPase